MSFLNYVFSFTPSFLMLHCLFMFLFKSWLGPMGTFYGSMMSFSTVLALSLSELLTSLKSGSYSFMDFGSWFYCIDLIDSHLVFCVDSLALVSSTLVLGLTMFALYFGVEYMYSEAFMNSLLYLLNLFATSVVFLFYCYDYFLMLFSWECMGLFSLLLVNFYSSSVYTMKAALKTFIFSRVSDMFMFFSFLLTMSVFSSTDLSIMFMQMPFMSFHYIFFGDLALHFLTLFSFCLVTSGGMKAAQFFSHVWLPDAMEAPTPASALIHSSTLVVAGVFLIMSFAMLFEFTTFTNYFLTLLGALTLSFGAMTATFQNDMKKLVAYSTMSQMGYLVCGCGFCCYEEVLMYLIIHALNKAFLFVLVGYTVHFFSGNTDMRQMGGAYLYSFDIAAMLLGVSINLAGLPYSAGFLGKEFLLFQVLSDDFMSLFVSGCWLVSFFFTPMYMLALVFLVMFGPKKGSIVAYKSGWGFAEQAWLFLSSPKPKLMAAGVNLNSVYSFTFTTVTSSSTSYFLFSFWLFFFFFGESLLLMTMNFSNLTDLMSSSSFFTIKQHTVFYINSATSSLLSGMNSYMVFLTASAMGYLVNLNFSYAYNYFSQAKSVSLLAYAALLFSIVL